KFTHIKRLHTPDFTGLPYTPYLYDFIHKTGLSTERQVHHRVKNKRSIMLFSFFKLMALLLLGLLGIVNLTGCQWLTPSAKLESQIQLDKDWAFFRSDDNLSLLDAQGQTSWERVQLPHTPKIEPYV